MNRIVASLIAAGFAGVPVSVAAADPVAIASSSNAMMPVHDDTPFDWGGFYAGVYGTIQTDADQTAAGLGVRAGVDAQFDFFLVGAEVSVQGLNGDVGTEAYGELLGRAGLVVTDDVVVYAAGGYGLELGLPDEGDVRLGGGAEIAITDSLSLDARYLGGLSLDGGEPRHQVTLGANFHF